MPWQDIDLTTDPHEPEYRGDPADLLDAYAELLEALERPAWHSSAACRGRTDLFFPRPGEGNATAKALCARCPVRGECEATALADKALQGTWAGMSERERRTLRRGAA